jgi:hypothetical protein
MRRREPAPIAYIIGGVLLGGALMALAGWLSERRWR